MGRIGRGWEIAKQSWKIVLKDKALLPFPLLSALSTLVLLASFIAPLFAFPDIAKWLGDGFEAPKDSAASQQAQLFVGAALLAFYVVNYFIVVFFNTALAACAATRFKGETPTCSGGLKVALSRLPQILAWVVLAATVGVVLRTISERSQLLGKLVVGLIGIAWTIAAYLVVPILAVEGLGPIAALKRSSHLISSSWGEGLAGNVGMGLLNFLLLLPGILLLAGGALNVMAAPVAAGIIIALSVLYLIAIAVITSAMKQVFIVGIYFYAAEQRAPAGFSIASLEGAFQRKQ